jgi:hypothetical protein
VDFRKLNDILTPTGDRGIVVENGDSSFVRKTMLWHVAGFWRKTKSGKLSFVQGHWRGPLRDMAQETTASPRERELVINNKICVVSGNQNNRDRYAHLIGSQVLTFKGEAVNLKIIQGEKVEHMNLISYPLGLHIVKNILNIINYNYGRTEANRVTSVQWG